MFALGQVVATRGVADCFAPMDLLELLHRHSLGDWGTVCPDDAAANDLALIEGGRLLSAYAISGRKVWVITEADRSSTTVLFPDEY